jgi:hypothetical protein
MNFRRLLFTALVCLWASACGKVAPGGGKLNDACLRSTDCMDPFICSNGHCQLDSFSRVCVAGQLRCNGDDVEMCTDTGDAYEMKEHCDRGCVGGACRPAVCTAGAQRCSGNTVEECLPSGVAWAVRQVCPTSCEVNVNDETKAACGEPICAPFETKCSENNPGVLQTCNSNGTAYTDTACSNDPAAHPAACLQGRCLPVVCTVTRNSMNQITGRAQRCRGVVAEQCNDSGTAWEAREICENACAFNEMSGQATCPAQICAPFSTRCNADRVTLETCNSSGTAYTNTTCAGTNGGEARCANGGCAPKVCSVVRDGAGTVTGRDEQCVGNVRQQCNDTETAFENLEYCQYGCSENGQLTQCAAPACQVGEERCDGLALQMCAPDQSGFAFVQYCASGCEQSGTSADCKAPTCAPLARRCGTNAQNMAQVEVCRADGTQYDAVETCPQSCVGGVCVVTDSQCTPGDLRCQGPETQLCVKLANGATEWRFNERCFGTCSSGVCSSNAACGCSGGASATSTCGPTGATRSPLVVKAMLPSGTTVPCADATSTSRVLLYTDVITSSSGVVVPDGTMVTFANDYPAGTPDSLIVSADADAAVPGIQRPTQNGRATALLQAPTCAAARTVTVTASAGGNCGGTTTVAFAPASGTTRNVYVAEDFTSDRFNDRAFTTAQWDVTNGAAVATPSYSLGTGADNDLDISGSTFDLQTNGYATAWNVTALTAFDATVDSSTPITLVPGDEVLVITLWGPSGSTGPGNYEFKKVASAGGSRITFTESVRNSYGNGTNADISGHRVVVQRVPQFRNLTVRSGATLTSKAPDTAGCSSSCLLQGGTGVMAFRVKDMLSVRGSISMDGAGLPPNLSSYPSISSTASLNRLLLGRSGTGTGGGVIFIAAGTVSFAVDPSVQPPNYATAGLISANASTADAGGGTIWLSGGSFQFGPSTRVMASVGSSNRVRLDYGSLDNTFDGVQVAGSQFVGQSGAVVAQSRSVYQEPTGTAKLVTTVRFLGAVGGSGTSAVSIPGTSSLFPGLAVFASGDDGLTWGNISTGTLNLDSNGTPELAQVGRSFKHKATLSTVSDSPLRVRGVAYAVSLQ